MNIINFYYRVIQLVLPIYTYYIIFTIYKIFSTLYIKYKNIKILKLNKKIIIYNYNKNNKSIVVINGGGLIFEDTTDHIISTKILNKLPNYNIIVIKYNLFDKFSKTSKEVNDTFNSLLKYNFNIEVFIGNSIGCTLLVELFKINKQFTNKKLILISPLVKFDLKYNNNMNKDAINYDLYNYIKNMLYDREIIINYDTLPKVFTICGSNEIFYHDIIEFNNKCKNSKLYIIDNGIHSEYIIYGYFKISKITNEIINFIMN